MGDRRQPEKIIRLAANDPRIALVQAFRRLPIDHEVAFSLAPRQPDEPRPTLKRPLGDPHQHHDFAVDLDRAWIEHADHGEVIAERLQVLGTQQEVFGYSSNHLPPLVVIPVGVCGHTARQFRVIVSIPVTVNARLRNHLSCLHSNLSRFRFVEKGDSAC
jgi:hypothetical protein